MRRRIFDAEHEDFRASVRSFLAKEAVPHTDRWEAAGMVDRSFWELAAANGLVGFEAPVEYGGAGVDDFRFNVVLGEEVAFAAVAGDGFMLENDIIAPYLIGHSNDEQKRRWLPGFTSGTLIAAIAMSEPGAGSDLRAITTTAVADGDGYRLSGSKTFVTSGIQADIVIVAARNSGAGGGRADALSLLVVESGMEGFSRGRKLDKVGRRAQDTAELFFDAVPVPRANLLGAEGAGMDLLKSGLPRERLSIAVSAVAAAELAFSMTLTYCRERHSFGRPIGSHQAIRFELAQMRTELDVARAYIDSCIESHVAGELADHAAAGAKRWTTELQFRVLDRCMQMHGGYGYMEEYPIARLWRDGRVQRIYGGTSEIMSEIVGRALGL